MDKNKLSTNSAKFFNVNEVYSELYYQMPKILFTSEKYSNLSDGAKIAYMLLKDRNKYSVKNNWFDEEGRIFFIYTNKELESVLHCGNKKVVRIKRELEDAELIYQKRMGLNAPNRLYLLRPDVNAHDIYNLQLNELGKIDNSDVSAEKDNKESAKHAGNCGSVVLTLPDDDTQSLGGRGSVKTTHNQYNIIYSDTITDTNIDTHNAENLSTDKVQNFFDIFSADNKIKINLISRNTDLSVDDIHNIIFITKAKALQANGLVSHVLDVRNFQNFISVTLKNVILKIKKNNVKNLKGYMYKSFLNGWTRFADAYVVLDQEGSYEDLVNVDEQVLLNIYHSHKLD